MSTTTAPLTVAEATQHLRDAEAALARLHDRLAAGDSTITPAAFEKAESAVRFAQARLRGAERQAEAQAEAARLQRIEQLREELTTTLDPAPVEQARQAMETAIEQFVAACRAYDDRCADADDALADPSLAPLPRDLGKGDQPGHLRVGGQEYRRARPQMGIHRAGMAAITRYYPRHQVNLGNPQD